MTFLFTYYGPGPLYIIGLVLGHREGDQWLVALTAIFTSGRTPIRPCSIHSCLRNSVPLD